MPSKIIQIIIQGLTKTKEKILELFEKQPSLVVGKRIDGNYVQDEARCLTARKTRDQVLEPFLHNIKSYPH